MSVQEQIKFDSPNTNTLVWKYPTDSILLGSQIIVNQSQEAIFVKGGQATDIFGPGTHTLETANLPLLGKIINFTFGKKTPFTAEIWFVNKTIRRGLKWGTPGGIQIIDPQYNFPVSVRAFGEWGLRVSDTQSFVNQIVGAQIGTDSDRIEEYFGGEIVQKLSNTIADYFEQNKISVFQINSVLNKLSKTVQSEISAEFERFGIEIVNFNIARISIPDEEQKKFQEILGKKMEILQLSDTNVSSGYKTIKTLDILSTAAENEGGGIGTFLGAGIGLGAGMPLGQQFIEQVNEKTDTDPVCKLQKLKQMLDAGLITESEYNNKKQQILSLI